VCSSDIRKGGREGEGKKVDREARKECTKIK
jgi:hypothetical protein